MGWTWTTPQRLGLAAFFLVLSAIALSPGGVVDSRLGGWPVAGLVLCMFLALPRSYRLAAFAIETVVAAISIIVSYEYDPGLSLIAALAITLPAWLGAHLLAPDGVLPLPLRDVKSHVRLYTVLEVMALLLGLLALTSALPANSVRESLIVAAVAFLSALAGYLIVLPLFFPPAKTRRGPIIEWVFQGVATAVIVGLVFWPSGLDVPVFIIFPLLAWGAARTPHLSVTVQLMVVCSISYGLTVTGNGPFTEAASSPSSFAAPLYCYLFMLSCCFSVIMMVLTMTLLDQTAEEASMSAATVEQLLSSATGTILVAVDTDGNITRLNTGASTALGYQPEEVLGRSPALFHPAAERARHASYLRVKASDFVEILRAQERAGKRRDWEYVRKDGATGIMSMQVSTLRDPVGGEVVGYLTAGEDVTERHRTQQALSAALERERSAVDRLREVDEVKQELVSNVSHELRTPITSVMGYTELLMDGDVGELSESQRRMLDRIQRNSERLQGLVSDLLTLAREEGGHLELELVPTDLVKVAQDAVELITAGIKDRRLSLVMDLPEHPVEVCGDSDSLERVLINLLSNAAKFTPDGGSVEVSLRSTGEAVHVQVADTGMGMSQADQEKLFTRFFRSKDTAHHAIPGTGLGLSIVDALVTAHDGTISVDSTLGEGTTVTVTLPRTPVSPEVAEEERSTSDARHHADTSA